MKTILSQLLKPTKLNWSVIPMIGAFLLLAFGAGAQEHSFKKGLILLEDGKAKESYPFLLAAKDSFLLLQNDSLIAGAFHELGRSSLFQGKTNESLSFIESGLTYARRTKYSLAYTKLLLFKSEYYNMKGNSSIGRMAWRELQPKMKFTRGNEISALRSFALAYLKSPSDTCEQILSIALQSALLEHDSIRICNIYKTLTDRAIIKSNLVVAIEHCIEGVKYVPKGRDEKKGWFLLSMADSFYDLKNSKKAIHYVRETINLLKNSPYKNVLNHAYSSYAKFCLKQNNPECAEQNWEKAISFFRTNKKYEELFSVLYDQLFFKINTNNFSAAKKFKSELDKIEPFIKSDLSINERNEAFAIYYFFLKDFKSSSKYLKQWQQTFPLVANPNSKIKYLRYKALLLEKNNQIEKSIASLKTYKKLKDSIQEKRQIGLIYLMEGEFNRKENENEIAKLNGINQVKSAKLQQRKIFLWLGGLFLLFAVLASWFLKQRNSKIQAQQKEIAKNLKEKDLLLDEIHFRVKNSLQTISSILNLQARTVNDEKALTAIKEGRNRVNSMALLHENLSLKDANSEVEMKGYFDQLLSQLFKSYNIEPNKIRLEKNILSTKINIDKVILIGLILNELVSNALKHAFEDKERGLLKVDFYKESDNYHLIVTDDGVGKKEGIEPDKGFGSRIIQTFSKKLNAQVSQIIGNGTSIRISFPAK